MNRKQEEITYNIQQVSEITGLSKQVIRKWEERYGIVMPERLDNGYRIYNQLEVQKLLHVKSLIEQGQTVKQAALQSQDFTLKQQINLDSLSHVAPSNSETTEFNQFVVALLHYGTNGDEFGMSTVLTQAHHTLGLEAFLNETVTPFLREIGERWYDQRWGEYQEALASSIVRDFLVQIRRNFKVRENAPLLLGACLPNERHELPLHIILLKAMLYGWKTTLLGSQPAPMAIESTVQHLEPKVVILSASTDAGFEDQGQKIKELDKFAGLHSDISFYLGGYGAMRYIENHTLKNIKVTNDLSIILTISE